MRILRALGWVCSRSAMSHGPVDVFAAKTGKILLIQVKSGSARAKRIELETLRVWAEHFNADAEVWSFKSHGMLQKIRISSAKKSEQDFIQVSGQILSSVA
jgi:Holliday junction resolvase